MPRARSALREQGLFDPERVHPPVAEASRRSPPSSTRTRKLLDAIAADLGVAARGRAGLSCETVLRCAVLKHLRHETWRGLEYTLRDSAFGSAAWCVRIPPGHRRSQRCQATVGAVRPETWEQVNRHLPPAARDGGAETAARMRVDSTVTETHILAPANSRLLYDGVRVLTRLLAEARQLLGAAAIPFHDHRRAAKRRHLEARSQCGRERRAKTYRRLSRLTRRTLGYVDGALPVMATTPAQWGVRWTRDVRRYADLLRRAMDQAERRVLHGDGEGRKACSSRTRQSCARATATPSTATRSTSPPGAAAWCSTRWWRRAVHRTVRAAWPCSSAIKSTTVERRRTPPSTAATRRRDNLAQAKALGVGHVVSRK